jgi:7-cyano-7-deazaguanine synthase
VNVVAIVSGGLDSVTMAHQLADDGHHLAIVSVDYGQRHRRELTYAERCAERLSATYVPVDLRSVTAHLAGSALTDPAVDVPMGHYAAPSMSATVVPNRNMMLIAVAAAIAVGQGAQAVATAVHAGDHPIYPDCRPEFIDAMSEALRIGNAGHRPPGIMAPFVDVTKADIVRIGAVIGVPFAETWSCYLGGDTHCGTCGTCVERREEFELAGVVDPTTYEAAAA